MPLAHVSKDAFTYHQGNTTLNKLLTLVAAASLLLAACSEPSVEEQFFGMLEQRAADLERVAEQDSVCMSQTMEVANEDQEQFMRLGEELEAKHGSELPEAFEARMEVILARFETSMIQIMPKMDPEC